MTVEEERKRWWRIAAISVVGGGVVLGGWFKLMRPATAEPTTEKFTALASDPSNTESVTTPKNSMSEPIVHLDGEIVRASATMSHFPEVPGAPGSLIPAATPAIPLLVPPLADVKPSGPHCTDPNFIASGPTLPALPPIPSAGSVQPNSTSQDVLIPAVPQPPAIPSVNSGIPQVPDSIARPFVPMPTPPADNSSTPSMPPAGFGIAQPADITPPAPSIKFPDTVQTTVPIVPDSRLKGSNEGITVKTEKALIGGNVSDLPVVPPTRPITGEEQFGGNQTVPIIPPVTFPSAPPGSIVDAPKQNENVFPRSEKDPFLVPSLSGTEFYKVQTPGDDTMLKPHQHVAALAVLGGMFLAPSTATYAAKDDKTDLANLKGQIEDANKKLAKIQEQLDRLTELMEGKRSDNRTVFPPDDSILAQIKALKLKLEAMDKDLTAFKNSQTSSSASLRPQTPTNGTIVDPRAGKGIVRVVNDYPVQISMVINGISYKIPPSKALDFDVTAGDFTYQLIESGAPPTKSNIKEKETVTLRIK